MSLWRDFKTGVSKAKGPLGLGSVAEAIGPSAKQAAQTAFDIGVGSYGVKQANQANIAAAEKQMNFQERMSSTALQRSRADAQRAGFNPILGMAQGGATTPGGASSVAQPELTGSVNSAIEAKRSSLELKNLVSQNKQIESQTQLNGALQVAALGDANYKMNSAMNVAVKTREAQNLLPLSEYLGAPRELMGLASSGIKGLGGTLLARLLPKPFRSFFSGPTAKAARAAKAARGRR